ncbi:hypothetical protein ACFTAO_47315 [Paenibacillus rhizoplanae]
MNITFKGWSITNEPIARRKPLTNIANEFRKASKPMRLSSSSANAGSFFTRRHAEDDVKKTMLITICAAMETKVNTRMKEPQ